MDDSSLSPSAHPYLMCPPLPGPRPLVCPVGISDNLSTNAPPDLSSCAFTISADGNPVLPLPRPETIGSSLTLFSCRAPHSLSGTPGSSTLKRSPQLQLPLTTIVSYMACHSGLLLGVPPLSSVFSSVHLFNTVARVILLKLQISVCHVCLKAYHGFCLHLESTPGPFTWPPRPSGIYSLLPPRFHPQDSSPAFLCPWNTPACAPLQAFAPAASSGWNSLFPDINAQGSLPRLVLVLAHV